MIKRLTVLGLCLAFVFHFAATLVYLSPESPIKSKLNSLVYRYMNPLFAQSWLLFAPNPSTSSQKFWIRCQGTQSGPNQWSSWYDPVEALMKEHYKNRMTFRGKLIYVHRSIPGQLASTHSEIVKSLGCKAEQSEAAKNCRERALEKLQSTPAFLMSVRYAKDFCEKIDQMEGGDQNHPTRVQFMNVAIRPKNFSERESGRTFGLIEHMRYPEVRL